MYHQHLQQCLQILVLCTQRDGQSSRSQTPALLGAIVRQSFLLVHFEKKHLGVYTSFQYPFVCQIVMLVEELVLK